ncbi:MAG: DNA mismatch repair protein MutT [Phyllobacteriaceae bacterium]|nr:DNA mismatch repair protein MutT [Phyllobacteriaceae bacterium]MBA92046.1 DNA mismatch repair protein MutT [Phyllobacteriaceae bacterium]
MMPEREGKTLWRIRLFHIFFLLARPMTLGVRAIVHDRARNAVFLVRHTYVPGWQLPGGGVEPGESADDALARELREEGNLTLTGPARLVSFHFNRRASRRDHVALYLVEAFDQTGPRVADREIAEAGFFPLDALPEETTRATRARLAEVFGDAVRSPFW